MSNLKDETNEITFESGVISTLSFNYKSKTNWRNQRPACLVEPATWQQKIFTVYRHPRGK
jgi:hypothetical protein